MHDIKRGIKAVNPVIDIASYLIYEVRLFVNCNICICICICELKANGGLV